MPRFVSRDGVDISYEIVGDGPAVVLLHGFASDSFVNWVRPGIVDALADDGWRAITMDHRGHGSSGKPHEPDAYEGGALAGDVTGLLDHLSLDRCHLVGFSMGAFVALAVAPDEDRVRSLVLGGIGDNALVEPDPEERHAIADALTAADPASITDRRAKGFRDFADLTGADREALAALQRARRDERYARPRFDEIDVPTLVVCGDRDDIAGTPHALAERISGARAEVVGGTHLNVVNNPEFHRVIVGFLADQASGR